MKVFVQIFILMLFTYLGEVISSLLPFSFPGSLIGLLLLFLALLIRIIRPILLKEVSDFLQKYMAFLFVPLCVGVMTSFGVIKAHWLEILLALVGSTLVTFVVTGLVAKRGVRK